MFKHFVLTRFNVKLEGITALDKNNRPVMTEEWLEKRFSLFDTYCFPSLMKQSTSAFIWFILFSDETPERFIKKIRDYEIAFPQFKPLFLRSGDYESIRRSFNDAMTSYLEADDQYIITTRIDNDDAFHEEMIASIQKQFVKKDDLFVSFTHGLQVDINRRVVARMESLHNHFVSRIERRTNNVHTVITHDHAFINQVAEVVYIHNRSKPLWLEIIHDNNIKNDLDDTSIPLISSKRTYNFQLRTKISAKNTVLALIIFLKLRVLLVRAAILKKLGIYDFLRALVKRKHTN